MSTRRTPLYQQAKAYVISHITSGKWQPNQRILSEHELARMFRISRMTANRAMTELTKEGYVTRLIGAGTFVLNRKPRGNLLEVRNIADEIVARGHRHHAEVIAHESVTASQDLARSFNAAPGALLYHSLVVHLEDDEPIQMEDRYVSARVVPGYLGIDLTRCTANQYLRKAAPLAQAEHVVCAMLPSRRIARLLKMRHGEPCLLLRRRTWSNGTVASIAHLYYPGSRYDLIGRFRPEPA